jgi:hypothetical protein
MIYPQSKQQGKFTPSWVNCDRAMGGQVYSLTENLWDFDHGDV